MKEGLSLQEMAAEIERQSSLKEDYLVDTRNLHMESFGSPVSYTHLKWNLPISRKKTSAGRMSMNNLNDIFFAPAASEGLTYEKVLENVQQMCIRDRAMTADKRRLSMPKRKRLFSFMWSFSYLIKVFMVMRRLPIARNGTNGRETGSFRCFR